MKYEYTFERLADDEVYQVRLNGEFITCVDKKDPKIVDARLKEEGWDTREEYFKYITGQ